MIPYTQLILGTLMLAIVALLAWVFWTVPKWSRPGIYFAVTVPIPFLDSPEAREILHAYRWRITIHLAISVAMVLSAILDNAPAFLMAGILWLIGGPLVAFIQAHRRAMPYAVEGTTVREAVLEPRRPTAPGGWIAQSGPFATLIAVAVYLQLRWNEIPDRFPVHWGIDGRPNGWSSHTPMGVYAPILMGFVVIAVIIAAGYAVRHSARVNIASTIGSVAHDFAHRIGIFLLVVEYFLAIVFSLTGLLALMSGFGPMALLLVVMLLLAGLFIMIPWLNKGRTHPLDHGAAAAATTTIGDGTPDACWKLGMFYFNPDDAALFVEKRFGIGYTLNFAHPSAWVCMAMVLLMPVVILLLVLHQR
jgi:uncharacterized membrane protein